MGDLDPLSNTILDRVQDPHSSVGMSLLMVRLNGDACTRAWRMSI